MRVADVDQLIFSKTAGVESDSEDEAGEEEEEAVDGGAEG